MRGISGVHSKMGPKAGLRQGHSPDSSSCWSSLPRWLLGLSSSGRVVLTQGSLLLPSPPCILHPMHVPPLHSSGLQSIFVLRYPFFLVTCQSLDCRLNHSQKDFYVESGPQWIMKYIVKHQLFCLHFCSSVFTFAVSL